ncbi:class I SAM-dependent methyltransferase [Neobacillus bataviensis]|uniref:class I SAM-dependent methyltransferase n=1 Tax=Neobacillus bataviensis TaxID=220685 RepID=UPI001CBAFE97|nr:SAM-dependent methyltransferase [Neobacillus bataviensis]
METYLQQLISNSPSRLISYADFIGAALYHPQFGYYMKDKQKIGRLGDFITTSNISDVYGRLIAKWFSRICKTANLDPVFCEIGAGNGRFAQSFLQEWHETINTPLQYIIVETSPFHRNLQKELLKNYPSVIQIENLMELKAFEGVIFSNELFDALPVHVIEKSHGQLFEVMVGYQSEDLVEKKIPLENEDILCFLRESGLALRENQRIEIPIEMEKMLQSISNVLTKGFVVTADYGYTNEEWMNPRRAEGSLRGYHQHRMINNVLENPGEMDITTHIHFDYLIQKGEQFGLRFLTKLRQDEFLLKTGILKELEDHYDPNPFSEVSKRNRAIRSLIMPSGMSSYFHIIIQLKGLHLNESDLFSL